MRRSLVFFALALLAVPLAACSGDDTSASGPGGPGQDAGTDAEPAGAEIRVEPAGATATVDIGGAAAPPVTFRAYYRAEGEEEIDVTDQATWGAQTSTIASVTAGSAQPLGIGGKTQIVASFQGTSGSGNLTVQLTGEVFLGGLGPEISDAFDVAGQDPDAANAPLLEYPQDGVVLPGNLPPIEAQWSQASDSNVYRVHLESPELLDVAFFTTSRELLFPPEAWSVIRQSVPDAPLTLTVEGLGATHLLRSSGPHTLTITADTIDESAIYVWQSSTGTFRVLDVIQGTDIALPSNSPQLGAGQPCSGCHRISRDGKRFAYSYDGANFQIGTLAYDEATQIFAAKIAPTPGVRGTYASFNPLEESTRPAMLLSVPDDVAQNSAGTVRLMMVDPDTNAPIASNIAETTLQIDPAIGHGTLMPDWSPKGDFVVFVAYNSDATYVREVGDDVALGSIVEASVAYNASTDTFQFGAPKVLVAADPAAGADAGHNHFLPTISPDGSAVAFTRSAGYWSLKTQQSLLNLSGQVMVVRRSDGRAFELSGGSSGPGQVWSSTWPQWAPSLGQRYAWLAYASERPYGHRLTPASYENSLCARVQGQQQCKQLWITAIDRDKLATGDIDPSAAPFWIPGQTLSAQYVSPQWTKAVLPAPQ
ncbi:PD40 domain-containing protein [Chondromyces apiculatus]|uniref:TolB protein n=1 Tax=Chondromyces apiculatus DSM 436 TaxID=1192034 RepID=A0A017T6C9_9BACT|nr:PD40 domain-containing protein [Chondromyces apiculatus]EYF04355.1 Hypothetical protein CAP_4619 [Chondromyces apiculatus DSM 436]